jgi:3-methyladenine DNA glycosylase AlkD
MADVRRIVHDWWPAGGDVELACRLIEEPLTEDKLAGILALAEILVDELGLDDIPRFGRLFAEGHLRDWGSCDWFCVKVLGQLLQRAEDPLPLAEAIGSWRDAETLWQRRASVVGFVTIVPKPEEHFPGLVEIVFESCEVVARSDERFAQTAVGWTLRELRRASPDEVDAWVVQHASLLTADARKSLAGNRPQRGRKRRGLA